MSDLTKVRDELKKEMRDFQTKMERDLRKELREMKASLDVLNEEYEKSKAERIELAKKNNELKAANDANSKELIEMKASLNFFNGKYEETKAERTDLSKENKELKASNEKLAEECRALKKQASQLENRVTASEQYSRNRNLEIKGMPLTENENTADLVRQIGDALEVPIEESEIEVCHRVPVKNPSAPPNIVVQFKSRAKRETVLKKAKKMRISTEDLGFSCKSPLYINEHLCPALKQLLGMAIVQKKAKGWRFVWSCDGKILARKEELSPIVHIRNAQDVEKIA